jgi:hypothetical protein
MAGVLANLCQPVKIVALLIGTLFGFALNSVKRL